MVTTKRKISSYLSPTPEEIAEYWQAVLDASLFRLKIGLQILAKAQKIQEFHEKNSK